MFEKLSKCKDLQIEVIKTLPVVIGASGVVAKTVPNYVSQIPGSPPLTSIYTTHVHRTYSAEGTINVIFTFLLYMYLIPNIYNKLQI